MTVRVERTFHVEASPEAVWTFIADPGKRAGAISVVDSWEHEDGETVWHVRLPIPVINRTVEVRTRDEERRDGEYVRFVGRSRVMRVQGEHELAAEGEGTAVTNRFIVDGDVPGVERFFKRNLDGELDNLKAAMEADLGVEPSGRED